MKQTFNFTIAYIALFLMLCSGCKKFLEVKPDKKLVPPSTFSDLEAILNGDFIMNSAYPVGGELGCDNFYLTQADWNSLTDIPSKQFYIWDGAYPNERDWKNGYDQVFNANVVLDNIEKIRKTSENEARWGQVKGTALFFRSHSYYYLAQIFSEQYDSLLANNRLGIPLKLIADINTPTVRSTLKVTYQQIFNDLVEAAKLLPPIRTYKTQPCKAACFAQLARVLLAMGNYHRAFLYADSCLQVTNTLIDYNTINAGSALPFSIFNSEVIFHCTLQTGNSLAPARCKGDTLLYKSYKPDDLRRVIFFRQNTNGSYAFKGSYSGANNSSLFGGIATDEVYLIRAECNARIGNLNAALADLNTLMQKRWKNGLFAPFTATSPGEALLLILNERRKELCFRADLRWFDLRRLNRQPGFETTLTRTIGNQVYTLPPNDKRYVFLIPQSVIDLTGIPQNER